MALADHPDLFERWTNIFNRLTTHKRQRNDIAHGTVHHLVIVKDDGTNFPKEPTLQSSFSRYVYGTAAKQPGALSAPLYPPDSYTLQNLKAVIHEFAKDERLIETLRLDYEIATNPEGLVARLALAARQNRNPDSPPQLDD